MNPQFISNTLDKMGKVLIEKGPEIAKKVGSAVVIAVTAIILTSKYWKRVNKELMKKHDKETAERLSKEFNKKLEMLRKEYEDKHIKTKEEFRQKVSELCREFGIDPKNIVK
jgi:uncharacterized membrane protein (DUF106 family)